MEGKKNDPRIVLVSAKNSVDLQRQVEKLGDFLDANPDQSLDDVAFSLATTRTHFSMRQAFLLPLYK